MTADPNVRLVESTAWYVHFPGQVYANGPVRFDQPADRERMMEWVRNYLTVDGEKLPIPEGTEVWPAAHM